MISYQAYKWIHFVGIFFIFMSLGGAAFRNIGGLAWDSKGKGVIAAMHGCGLLLALLGGFGLLARMNMMAEFPAWVWGKLTIWLIMGAAIALFKRKPQASGALILLLGVLGTVAAALALFKPAS